MAGGAQSAGDCAVAWVTGSIPDSNKVTTASIRTSPRLRAGRPE